MCLFIILLAFGPRSAIVIWWLAEPSRWNATFDHFIWPLIGFLLLPWTTLVYVLVAPGGVHGFDVLWLVLAVLCDLATHSTQTAYGRGRRTVAA